MHLIEITTYINAPVERVFDLARNIDVHVQSTRHTGEVAIAGRTSGLIELGETVTWRAKHFGIKQTLTTKIIELEYPHHFTDEMVNGAFKSFRHEHYFTGIGTETMMMDIFVYEAPLGALGRAFSKLILNGYMARLLKKRNSVIKELAEKA